MELAAIATIACGLTAVSVIVLGAVAVIVITTGGRGLIERFGGMIGLGGGGGNNDPMPQRERRVRPSGRSSELRARAQNLSFDEAVQSKGGNVPANNQQGGGNDSPPMQQQAFSAQASGIQPSRPSLSPSRPFQGSSSGGNSQRNQPPQNQPRQQSQRNWGDTLNERRAGQSQRPQAQQNQPPQGQQQNRQPQQNQQRQDPLQPSLRGGQQWQGNWGDTLNPQQAQQPQRQQNQNQPQQNPQQNQNQQNQQGGGLGDYRPQLRAKPGANTQPQGGIRRNKGRDSRFGDDYERLYGDGDGGFFEDG